MINQNHIRNWLYKHVKVYSFPHLVTLSCYDVSKNVYCLVIIILNALPQGH